MIKAVFELAVVSALVVCLPAPAFASSTSLDKKEPLLLIRMPDEESLGYEPSESEIADFVKKHEDYLSMRAEDLIRDTDLAARVLGQRQIFEELAAFRRENQIPVKVKFISWADAFRYFSDYAADDGNPQVVAQIGDTWRAYFSSLGVLRYERRHTWDVRLLWYWKDLLSAEEIRDGEGFNAVCARVHSNPPPEMIAPFAIPTGLDWNLLHQLSIWLDSAGLPSLVSVNPKLGLIPWKEAVFAGPEGKRATRFLMNLAEHGYLALPEKTDLTDDFLLKKYAMVVLGPSLPERAEQRLGPDWKSWIGGTLPPTIGATAATTVKGGSFLVVLDPSRGKNRGPIDPAQRLVDFFASKESQARYTHALAALPANPQALAESRYYGLFEAALRRGKAYPEIPEWAPVVENLATRDNIYAFWKRLSALGQTRSGVSREEQAIRESLILGALNSAEADVNKELSPGKLASLQPWLLVVSLLVGAVTVIVFWDRRVARVRAGELRKTRDSLATLERRLAGDAGPATEKSDTSPPPTAQTPAKGFPALYIDGVKRQFLLKRTPAAPLEEIVHGGDFDLFRHITECLQSGWYETHWIWTHVIWPGAHAKFPKGAFATHCTRLRKQIEKVWELGEMLGRGSHHGGAIPIEIRDVHFYTDAPRDGAVSPVWFLFQAWERASKAQRQGKWVLAKGHAEEVLRIDPDNWPANILLCWLAAQKHADRQDPLVVRAVEFAHRQKAVYGQAAEKIDGAPEERVSPEQKARMLARLESLQQLTADLPFGGSLPSAPAHKSWRTKAELMNWAGYLNGDQQALPEDEVRVLRGIRSFVVRNLHWTSAKEVEGHLRDFVEDLALDQVSWPDQRLPGSETAFKYQSLDYVLAGVCHLADDADSKAATKAQNLRKLWSARARLRQQLRQDPGSDDLFEECRRRYGWQRSLFQSLLELESSCSQLPLSDFQLEEWGELTES